jgi:carbonic anhydrase
MKRFVAAPCAAVVLGIAAGSLGAQAKTTEETPPDPALNCEIGGLTPTEARQARPSRLQILWNPAEEAEVVRDGDVLAVKLVGAGGVLRGERAYALTEVELRAREGSERYPAEARFIHKNALGDQVVVGVYLTEGETNPAFEALQTAADAHDGKAVGGLDPRTLLPSEKGRLVMASRTPPACAPRVMWTVVDEPVEASREQLMALLQLPADRPTRGGAE